MCGPGQLLLFLEPYHPHLEQSKALPRILPSKGLWTGRRLISSKPIKLILKVGKLRPEKGQSAEVILSDVVDCSVLRCMLGEVGGSQGKGEYGPGWGQNSQQAVPIWHKELVGEAS